MYCTAVVFATAERNVLNPMHKSRNPRRIADEQNDTLPDAIVEDGLDIPELNSTESNTTGFNETDTNDMMVADSSNTTDSPSLVSEILSFSPSTSLNPTQQITNNPSLSASPSIVSSTSSPTSISAPTSSPLQSTPAPTYGLLPIQPINILVLTDVHSWVQGHKRHDPSLDADYGDVLSFYQRLKLQIDSYKLSDGSTPDLYFVMNGDFVHGTVIGEGPVSSLSGIVERMPYDVVTLGNHDIRNEETVKELTKAGGLVDVWGKKLVTSNVRVQSFDSNQDKWVPLGNNFTYLHGNRGTILTLGFLYNVADDETFLSVETVQNVIEQSWFTSLFATPRPTEFHAILVMAHMNVDDELVTLLHDTLRKLAGKSTVIQFVTGHTHTQSFVKLDEYSTSFEAGKYLETIGFVSFDVKNGSFQHIFVDANKESIAQSLGLSAENYPTADGIELSAYIQRTFEHAGANRIIGCSPQHYRTDGYLNETDSLLKLYLEEIMPNSFLKKSSSGSHYSQHDNVLIQRLDWFVKYDLHPGTITLNDLVAIIPEDSTIVSISNSMKGKGILDIRNAWSNNITFLDNTTNVVGISLSNDGNDINIDGQYSLFTLSEFAPSLKDVINNLKIESFSSSHVVGEKTMRSMWEDYIRKNWPYDGNNCECIQNNTCGNSSNSGTSDDGSWPWEKQTSSSSNHDSTHISVPSRPIPPISENNSSGHHQSHTSSTSGISSNKTSPVGVILFAVALAAVFYTIRTRRQEYTAAHEVTRNNDLELRVTRPPGHGSVVPPAGYGNMNPQPSGYSSPQFSRGSYV